MLAYLRQSDYANALLEAKNFLDRQPENALSYGLLELVHEKSGNSDQAKRSYRRALEISPDYVNPTLALARLALVEGDKKEVDRLSQTLREQAGEHPGALAALVALGIEQRDWEVVRVLLERVTSENPELLLPHLILADVYAQLGSWKNALRSAELALKLVPDDERALLALGRAYRMSGDPQNAIDVLTALVDDDPSSREPQYELGLAHVAAGNILQATTYLQRTLRFYPAFYPAKVALARVELRRGRSEKALDLADEVVSEQPVLPIGHILTGDIFMADASFADAASAYRDAMELEPTSESVTKLSRVYWLGEQSQLAYDTVDQWLQENPRDTVARSVLASAYLEDNQTEKAVKQYEQILEADPDHLRALNDLA